VVLPLLSILVGELCLLVSWYASGRCDMVGIDDDRGRSRRSSADDRDGHTQVGYSVAE
jgi:hypothetical protein